MDRRNEPRTECADSVTVAWVDKTGAAHREEALLLNLSRSGARLHVKQHISVGTGVEIVHAKGTFPGTVTYCRVSKPNHNVGVRLAAGR